MSEYNIAQVERWNTAALRAGAGNLRNDANTINTQTHDYSRYAQDLTSGWTGPASNATDVATSQTVSLGRQCASATDYLASSLDSAANYLEEGKRLVENAVSGAEAALCSVDRFSNQVHPTLALLQSTVPNTGKPGPGWPVSQQQDPTAPGPNMGKVNAIVHTWQHHVDAALSDAQGLSEAAGAAIRNNTVPQGLASRASVIAGSLTPTLSFGSTPSVVLGKNFSLASHMIGTTRDQWLALVGAGGSLGYAVHYIGGDYSMSFAQFDKPWETGAYGSGAIKVDGVTYPIEMLYSKGPDGKLYGGNAQPGMSHDPSTLNGTNLGWETVARKHGKEYLGLQMPGIVHFAEGFANYQGSGSDYNAYRPDIPVAIGPTGYAHMLGHHHSVPGSMGVADDGGLIKPDTNALPYAQPQRAEDFGKAASVIDGVARVINFAKHGNDPHTYYYDLTLQHNPITGHNRALINTYQVLQTPKANGDPGPLLLQQGKGYVDNQGEFFTGSNPFRHPTHPSGGYFPTSSTS